MYVCKSSRYVAKSLVGLWEQDLLIYERMTNWCMRVRLDGERVQNQFFGSTMVAARMSDNWKCRSSRRPVCESDKAWFIRAKRVGIWKHIEPIFRSKTGDCARLRRVDV